MPITIYHWENNASEEWIIVNDDGTVTQELENSGWVAAKVGVNNRKTIMTAADAKAMWPSRAKVIDEAFTKITTNKV